MLTLMEIVEFVSTLLSLDDTEVFVSVVLMIESCLTVSHSNFVAKMLRMTFLYSLTFCNDLDSWDLQGTGAQLHFQHKQFSSPPE